MNGTDECFSPKLLVPQYAINFSGNKNIRLTNSLSLGQMIFFSIFNGNIKN